MIIKMKIKKKYTVKHHPFDYESPVGPDDSRVAFIFCGDILKSSVNYGS